jgi:hypothetical protein
MKKILGLIVGGVLSANLLFTPAKAAGDDFLCQLLDATINECKKEAKKKGILGNPDDCDTLGLSLMGATVYTLSRAEKKPPSEELIKVGQILGKICYKTCMNDNEFINAIMDKCR